MTTLKVVTGSATVTTGFCYDKSGGMLSRTPSSGSGAQTLAWNDAGQVASITEGGKTASFVYDADGNELIRRDPGQSTFFAGDTEIMVNTSAATYTLAGAVRYYTLGGSGAPVAGEQSLKSGASPEFYALESWCFDGPGSPSAAEEWFAELRSASVFRAIDSMAISSLAVIDDFT